VGERVSVGVNRVPTSTPDAAGISSTCRTPGRGTNTRPGANVATRRTTKERSSASTSIANAIPTVWTLRHRASNNPDRGDGV
jgi:hypothetical protein